MSVVRFSGGQSDELVDCAARPVGGVDPDERIEAERSLRRLHLDVGIDCQIGDPQGTSDVPVELAGDRTPNLKDVHLCLVPPCKHDANRHTRHLRNRTALLPRMEISGACSSIECIRPDARRAELQITANELQIPA